MKLHRLILPLCLAVTCGSTAHSASIDLGSSSSCPIRVDGVIEQGDFEQFVKVASEAFPLLRQGFSPSEKAHTFEGVVCLNSPGGSFPEAIKIAKFISDSRIGTRILPDDSCYSSCAVLFMFGLGQHWEDGTFLNREMHSSSTLGFHRPSLSLPANDTYAHTDVQQAFETAIDATQLFIELSTRRVDSGFLIAPDLIGYMYAHRGDDFYLIDTSAKAGHWRIWVSDYSPPKMINEDTAFRICNNLINWKNGELHNAQEYRSDDHFSMYAIEERFGSNGYPLYKVNGEHHGYYEQRWSDKSEQLS